MLAEVTTSTEGTGGFEEDSVNIVINNVVNCNNPSISQS